MNIVAVALTALLSLSTAGCALDHKTADSGDAADGALVLDDANAGSRPIILAAERSPGPEQDDNAKDTPAAPAAAAEPSEPPAPAASDTEQVRDAKEAAEEAARKIFDAGVRAANKLKEVGLGAVQAVRDSASDDAAAQDAPGGHDQELVAGNKPQSPPPASD